MMTTMTMTTMMTTIDLIPDRNNPSLRAGRIGRPRRAVSTAALRAGSIFDR
jgi:hypothetical protein